MIHLAVRDVPRSLQPGSALSIFSFYLPCTGMLPPQLLARKFAVAPVKKPVIATTMRPPQMKPTGLMHCSVVIDQSVQLICDPSSNRRAENNHIDLCDCFKFILRQSHKALPHLRALVSTSAVMTMSRPLPPPLPFSLHRPSTRPCNRVADSRQRQSRCRTRPAAAHR